MQIELRDHIAQARHPITNEPLVHDGKPVPLFPDQRSIWLDGAMIGYVTGPPDYNIAFIVPETKLGSVVVGLVKDAVTKEFQAPKHIVSVKEE